MAVVGKIFCSNCGTFYDTLKMNECPNCNLPNSQQTRTPKTTTPQPRTETPAQIQPAYPREQNGTITGLRIPFVDVFVVAVQFSFAFALIQLAVLAIVYLIWR